MWHTLVGDDDDDDGDDDDDDDGDGDDDDDGDGHHGVRYAAGKYQREAAAVLRITNIVIKLYQSFKISHVAG